MKFLILIIILVSFALLQGCSSNKLAILEDNKDCTTAVEGHYSSPSLWNSYYPAILFKDGNLKLGNEILRDSSRVDFLTKATGVFQSNDTLFIPFSKIKAIIDSSRNCTYGEIPKNYSDRGVEIKIFLSYSEDSTYQPIYFDLNPNEEFGYCLKPGHYRFNKIQFLQKQNIDESLELPDLGFNADTNSTTYLGDIDFINSTNEANKCLIIPYKNIHNENDAAIGFMFGLIGTAINEALKSKDKDADGYYLLKITDDPAFKFISRLKHGKNIIKRNNY
jgi:hypothetical protein